jgi:hypothetical protein
VLFCVAHTVVRDLANIVLGFRVSCREFHDVFLTLLENLLELFFKLEVSFKSLGGPLFPRVSLGLGFIALSWLLDRLVWAPTLP